MITSLSEITGNAAEFQVCHDLAKRGLRAARTPFDKSPYDIICEYKNKFLRVQVKGTSKPMALKDRIYECYQFNIPNIVHETFDFLALVSTDLETIHYLSVAEIKDAKSTIRIPIKQMRKNKDLALVNYINTFINI